MEWRKWQRLQFALCTAALTSSPWPYGLNIINITISYTDTQARYPNLSTLHLKLPKTKQDENRKSNIICRPPFRSISLYVPSTWTLSKNGSLFFYFSFIQIFKLNARKNQQQQSEWDKIHATTPSETEMWEDTKIWAKMKEKRNKDFFFSMTCPYKYLIFMQIFANTRAH